MAMRYLFICALLCTLPVSVLGQTERSLSQPPQAESSDLSTTDWADRLMANDSTVRAIAEAALVQGAGGSLPVLRQFLDRRDEELNRRTLEVIRRIGPPAIPLLVE